MESGLRGVGIADDGGRLAGILPTYDAIDHDAHVLVARFDRPPGGFMRGNSMRVGAVENQLGVLVSRQFARDAEAIGRRQQMGSGDDAVLRARVRMIGVVDHYAALGIGERAREVVDVNQLEGVERLILIGIAEHFREVESMSGHTARQYRGNYECDSRREKSVALRHRQIQIADRDLITNNTHHPTGILQPEFSMAVAVAGGGP
jgi:hypothetical protein